MRCFARWWEEDGKCYRDQTILQFGESWKPLANFILLNPGSATPMDNTPQNGYLASKDLPCFVDEGVYYRFSIDRLMGDLLKLYAQKFDGGVIRIYNLFNLKNQHSGSAIEEYRRFASARHMHTKPREIWYADAPVIVAVGDHLHADPGLEEELKKYIALADPSRLYSLSKVGEREFAIKRARPDDSGLIESYHPSYTFKYGNRTRFE